jgi:RimJ/RimL family protein N-acetyltransferase
MNIQMRVVTLSDMGQILSWRNSEDCVKYSKSNSAISVSQHKDWFEARILRNSGEPYFIFALDNQDIGTVRFDYVESNSKIFVTSIIMNPDLYGRGYGSKILSLAINHALNDFPHMELTAEIHQQNIASRKIFLKNHFTLIDKGTVFGVYKHGSKNPPLNSSGT